MQVTSVLTHSKHLFSDWHCHHCCGVKCLCPEPLLHTGMIALKLPIRRTNSVAMNGLVLIAVWVLLESKEKLPTSSAAPSPPISHPSPT